MKTSKPEVLIFDIAKNHGVESDTVAYMLSAWVRALANYEEWLEDDIIEELQDDYNLDASEIEHVSAIILNALEANCIDRLVFERRAFIEDVQAEIGHNVACVKIYWG